VGAKKKRGGRGHTGHKTRSECFIEFKLVIYFWSVWHFRHSYAGVWEISSPARLFVMAASVRGTTEEAGPVEQSGESAKELIGFY